MDAIIAVCFAHMHSSWLSKSKILIRLHISPLEYKYCISLRNDILHLSVENDYYYNKKKSIHTFIQTSFKYSNLFILWNVEFIFQKLLLESHNSNSHKTRWRPGILHVMNSHGCPKMSILWIVCTALQGLYSKPVRLKAWMQFRTAQSKPFLSK